MDIHWKYKFPSVDVHVVVDGKNMEMQSLEILLISDKFPDDTKLNRTLTKGPIKCH